MCCEVAVAAFVRLGLQGKLLLNLSPQTVVAARLHRYESLHFLQNAGLQADRIIVELTEQKLAKRAGGNSVFVERRKPAGAFSLADPLSEKSGA